MMPLEVSSIQTACFFHTHPVCLLFRVLSEQKLCCRREMVSVAACQLVRQARGGCFFKSLVKDESLSTLPAELYDPSRMEELPRASLSF